MQICFLGGHVAKVKSRKIGEGFNMLIPRKVFRLRKAKDLRRAQGVNKYNLPKSMGHFKSENVRQTECELTH